MAQLETMVLRALADTAENYYACSLEEHLRDLRNDEDFYNEALAFYSAHNSAETMAVFKKVIKGGE
tara:strand:+ start:492 stop:689 length:198 start_codon:yes stop_codon:yes gene_type:complete